MTHCSYLYRNQKKGLMEEVMFYLDVNYSWLLIIKKKQAKTDILEGMPRQEDVEEFGEAIQWGLGAGDKTGQRLESAGERQQISFRVIVFNLVPSTSWCHIIVSSTLAPICSCFQAPEMLLHWTTIGRLEGSCLLPQLSSAKQPDSTESILLFPTAFHHNADCCLECP